MFFRRAIGLGFLLTLALGCAALRDDMARAETAYSQARYERALVWLEALERDAPSMDVDMRVRFLYMRGMTAYRLGKRDHALHYLALAREVAHEDDANLREDWTKTMDRTLEELTPTEATFHARATDPNGE